MLTRILPNIAFSAILSCLFVQNALAQDETNEEIVLNAQNETLIGGWDIDTSIPEAPGFSIIDANPSNVIDPNVAPVTFAQFTTFLDDENNLKPGFAIGGTPYWWFNRNKTLDDYRDEKTTGTFERFLANISVSSAFAEGGETDFDRVGIGLTANLFGEDYRSNTKLYNCVKVVTEKIDQDVFLGIDDISQIILELANEGDATYSSVADIPDEDQETFFSQAEAVAKERQKQRQKEFQKSKGALAQTEIKNCRAELEKDFRKRQSWTVAIGQAINLEDENGQNVSSDGGTIWSSYRRPTTGWPLGLSGTSDAPGYLTLFARHEFDRTKKVEVEDAMMSEGSEVPTVDLDASTLGVLFGIDGSDFKASFQYGWERIDYTENELNLEDDDFTFYALSLERRMNNNLWLKLQVGSTEERASVTSKEDEYFKLSFSYDFSNN